MIINLSTFWTLKVLTHEDINSCKASNCLQIAERLPRERGHSKHGPLRPGTTEGVRYHKQFSRGTTGAGGAGARASEALNNTLARQEILRNHCRASTSEVT